MTPEPFDPTLSSLAKVPRESRVQQEEQEPYKDGHPSPPEGAGGHLGDTAGTPGQLSGGSVSRAASCGDSSSLYSDLDDQLSDTEESQPKFNMPIHVSNPMIVVSNRLPFVLTRNSKGELERKSSAGGLVTAVAPVVIDCQGVWVGWTGISDFSESDSIPESPPDDPSPTSGLRSSQTRPVLMPDSSMFDRYYNGCCNATFWPLFHSMPDRTVFELDTWKAYCEVNEVFAQTTLDAVRTIISNKQSGSGKNAVPVVWLHDYHLMLAANTIRDTAIEEGFSIRMGFFLHIPFPSWDIIRIFPWCDEILQGMLGCDLIGFHIEDYCLNFLDCCQRCLGCRVDKNKMLVEHCGRTVQVKAIPIGIPYTRFVNLAATAPRVLPTSEVKVILGVDRLDYTKGLVARLKAFQRFFIKYPKWREKVILLQVAVPSRTDVKEYQELKEEIDKLVGSINGSFSTPTWSPIRYIYGCVRQDELAAYYRDAAVGLIIPLRDGMNLVAKEFVACQDDKDPGVLILSPFAGAGGLMQEALQVNPYEVENVADTLSRALEMPKDERQLRMFQLKKREKRMDVDAWVQSFLHTMGAIFDDKDESQHEEQYIEKMEVKDFDEGLGPLLDSCTKLGVILDFDGTLSSLARTPQLAIIPPETKRVLERLSNISDCHVAVISGRNLEDLQRKVGVEGITYAGNHGLEILHPDGTNFNHKMPAGYETRLERLVEELTERCTSHGAWVEPKGLLVAWHYREVPKEKRADLYKTAASIYEKHNYQFFNVSKRLENVPPVGLDRGRASIHILRSIFGLDWEERVQVIYAGDSAADEFAMEVLRGVAYTYKVINEDSTVITKTWANARLQGPDAVLTMLKYLERKLSGRKIKLNRTLINQLSRGEEAVELRVRGDDEDEDGYRPRSGSLSTLSRKFRARSHSQKFLANGSLRQK